MLNWKRRARSTDPLSFSASTNVACAFAKEGEVVWCAEYELPGHESAMRERIRQDGGLCRSMVEFRLHHAERRRERTMSTGESYYALQLTAQGVNSSAYYGITPAPNLSIAQGGASIYPTATAATFINIYPQELQIQAPAGTLSASVTIITSEGTIAGTFGVSPPINVALVLTLYGNGGVQLGQSIVDPGTEGRPFSFPVDGTKAMNASEATDALKNLTAKK
jgi:hypothetical protein